MKSKLRKRVTLALSMVALWGAGTGASIGTALATSGEPQKLGDGVAVVLIAAPVLGGCGALGRKLANIKQGESDVA